MVVKWLRKHSRQQMPTLFGKIFVFSLLCIFYVTIEVYNFLLISCSQTAKAISYSDSARTKTRYHQFFKTSTTKKTFGWRPHEL